jgi:hypothetical protein
MSNKVAEETLSICKKLINKITHKDEDETIQDVEDVEDQHEQPSDVY